MEKGKKVGAELRALAKKGGLSQAQLEEVTGIGHSTMSGYWSGRLPLGLKNGRRIVAALDAELSDLGLSEEAEAGGEMAAIHRTLAALEEGLARLTERVAALESAPRAPRRAQRAQ